MDATSEKFSTGQRVNTPYGPATITQVHRTRAQVKYTPRAITHKRGSQINRRGWPQTVSHERLNMADLEVIA